MYFKRLDMHGFKSFAEPVSIEFMDGMTCIVGPNGSGKSNISDAIKWVLGEQSPKNLRGGKMEEVIFAGTESRKARGIAEVTLVIDNKDGLLPIEYNEVAITRKMYRSGESEYFINGRPCRLKDIKGLIMDTGIGVEGYSLIGQGKISDIVNNRAEGRRELFEEAAGIVRYRTKKTEAERKLTNSAGHLDRVKDILSEIEGRIDGLKEDSIRAQEYIGLSARYKTIEINLAVRQAESLEERLKGLSGELEAAKQQKEAFFREKETNGFELTGIRTRSSGLEEKLENVRNRLMEELEKINRLKSSIEVAEEKLAAVRREFGRIEEELKKEELRMAEEARAGELLSARENQLEEKAEEKRKAVEEKEREYERLASAAASRLEYIEQKRSDVFELHSGISVGKTEILGLESLAEGLEKRKQTLLRDVEESELARKEMEHQIDNAEKESLLLLQQKEEAERKLSKECSRKDQLKAEGEKLAAETEELENRLHKVTTKRELLKGFETSYEGFGQAVKFIMGCRGSVAEFMVLRRI